MWTTTRPNLPPKYIETDVCDTGDVHLVSLGCDLDQDCLDSEPSLSQWTAIPAGRQKQSTIGSTGTCSHDLVFMLHLVWLTPYVFRSTQRQEALSRSYVLQPYPEDAYLSV